MTSFSYKLAKQVDGLGFYSEVTISLLHSTNGPSVCISENAFSWLKDIYGEKFWEWEVCDRYKKEAIFGVNYVLEATGRRGNKNNLSLIISSIKAHPAQTPVGSIVYSACLATCEALGISLDREPQIQQGKVIFFLSRSMALLHK